MIKLFQTSDWHIADVYPYGIKSEEVTKACSKVIAHALKDEADAIFHCGDLSDRGYASEKVRTTFLEIIKPVIKQDRTKMFIIPGSHDYKGNHHWREEFKKICRLSNWPIYIFDKVRNIELNGINVIACPSQEYNDEKDAVRDAYELREKKFNILLGHFTVQGSLRMGKVMTNKGISRDVMSGFNLCLMGHIHQAQDFQNGIDSQTFYAGSIYRSDFGDDAGIKGYNEIRIGENVHTTFHKVHTPDLVTIEGNTIAEVEEQYNRANGNIVRLKLNIVIKDCAREFKKALYRHGARYVVVRYFKVEEKKGKRITKELHGRTPEELIEGYVSENRADEITLKRGVEFYHKANG